MKSQDGIIGTAGRDHWILRPAVALLAAGLLAGCASPVFGGPTGMTVVSGRATAVQSGSQLNITTSQNTVLNWQQFNIGAGETTRFIQPSSTSVVWNRILDQNPSQIFGNLSANGWVVLWNQNGFYFGPNSVVNVGGGLVVTTASIPREPTGPGAMWQFDGPPPLARIVNYGQIKSQNGGSLFMVAENIENHGTLSAPDGTIGLYAGKEVLISERPDGRGVASSVTLPEGSVDNTGKIIADAGTVALHAQVVNQNGLVQADSVRQQNGTIELVASDAVNLGGSSVISADGGSTGSSAGGSVTIKSDGSFSDTLGSQISVAGGAEGGAGGHVEISAPNMPSIQSQIDGHANAGEPGGTLSIDPNFITLSRSGTGSTTGGTINSTDSPGASLTLNVNSAFIGFSQILLQAVDDITLAAGTAWNLNSSTGISTPGSILTLEAGRNIIFGNSSSITGGNGWSVRMAAGADFSTAPTAANPLPVVRGQGGIYLDGSADGSVSTGSGSIQTTSGNIQLVAGKEVLLGTGFVGTTAGGSISITAESGNVDAGRGGTHLDGSTAYQWQRNGSYTPFTSTTLSTTGGIDTLAGGDIDISAGGDIHSIGPTSGAYGVTQTGNVNLTAGGSVLGRFQLADGNGQINAGLDFGSGSIPATLGLISGAWDVNAGRDIILNEVLNPRGVFSSQALHPFIFDYALNASVTLDGGRSVQLMGNAPAHTANNVDRLPIYPPILDITAGAGGVHLGNEVILYPSPEGSLDITTTDGGPLYGGAPLTPNDAPQLQPGALNFARLVVSDSSSTSYETFDSGHGATPIHSDADGPAVQLNISGNVQNLYVQSPTEAIMNIGGNAQNFSYSGQNLGVNDVTLLNITGDFLTRSLDTSVAITGTPNASIFNPADTMEPSLGASLSFNPVTHQLTLQGVMTAAERDFLLNPFVQELDFEGNRVVDAHGNPVLVPANYTTDPAAILQLYTASQNIPPPQAYSGIQLGGPGNLNIMAHNMDLGVTDGIRSVGLLNNPNLASISPFGANISLQLGGNLEMTSSQIATFGGGNIDLTAGGTINVGSQQQFSSDDTPKGIYTGNGGHVNVTAVGDIEVNGSRIASYDGGDVSVVSQTGSVDAGNGGESSFIITTAQFNPATGNVDIHNDVFFSSGIVALTSTTSGNEVGNITVTAAKDILASSGGILQMALNGTGVNGPGANVNLNAGGDIDANLSGVIGQNVDVKAGGSVNGLIVGSHDVVVGAGQNANVTAVGGGNVSINAGGVVSGTAVGGGNVSVTGSEITASVASTGGNVSTSGDASGAKIGSFSGVAAPVAEQTTQDADKTIGDKTQLAANDDDDLKKKGAGKTAQLVRTSGRVTVILPQVN